jgi:hypothetical protein
LAQSARSRSLRAIVIAEWHGPPERKRLLQRRELLLKDRKATIETAAKEAERVTNKAGRVYVTSQQITGDEAAARKKAERDWDAKRQRSASD